MAHDKPGSNRIARSYVTAELMKRGYRPKLEKSGFFTTTSPSKATFRIKVHGQSHHNPWILREAITEEIEPTDDLFYILVFVPLNDYPKFNIWASNRLAKEATKIKKIDKEKGTETWFYGISWETAFKGLDRWKRLPP